MNVPLDHLNVREEAPAPRRRPAVQDAGKAAPPSKAVSWSIPGFGPMTRISTSFGEVPAQALRERDALRTHTGGFVRISKIRRYTLESDVLAASEDILPVIIRAGALGAGLPKQDIAVSAEQEIAVGGGMHGSKLVKARDLLSRPGVYRGAETIYTYTRIRCEEPVLVRSEGLWLRVG